MRIRFTAARARHYAEQMWFHDSVAPGQQLHVHAMPGIEPLALRRPNQRLLLRRGIEKIQDVEVVKARDAPQRTHRFAHLGTLQSAEKTERDAGCAGHGSQRFSPLQAQAAEALSHVLRSRAATPGAS